MGKRRRRNEAPTALSAIVGATDAGRAAAHEVLTRARWEEVAGVAFARRTRPERLERGILYVIVTSSTWAQELDLHAPLILERLRARGVAVDRLRFRIGDLGAPRTNAVHGPSREEREAARAQGSAPLPTELADPLTRIDDDDLRGILERTARAMVRRDAELEVNERAAASPKPRVPRRPLG